MHYYSFQSLRKLEAVKSLTPLHPAAWYVTARLRTISNPPRYCCPVRPARDVSRKLCLQLMSPLISEFNRIETHLPDDRYKERLKWLLDKTNHSSLPFNASQVMEEQLQRLEQVDKVNLSIFYIRSCCACKLHGWR